MRAIALAILFCGLAYLGDKDRDRKGGALECRLAVAALIAAVLCIIAGV